MTDPILGLSLFLSYDIKWMHQYLVKSINHLIHLIFTPAHKSLSNSFYFISHSLKPQLLEKINNSWKKCFSYVLDHIDSPALGKGENSGKFCPVQHIGLSHILGGCNWAHFWLYIQRDVYSTDMCSFYGANAQGCGVLGKPMEGHGMWLYLRPLIFGSLLTNLFK